MGQIKTGQVTVTNGSASVVGVASSWSTGILAGHTFKVLGELAYYVIASVNYGTQTLTLTSPYSGVTGTKDYLIHSDYTPTLGLPEIGFLDADWPILMTRGFRQLDTAYASIITTAGSDSEEATRFAEGYRIILRTDLATTTTTTAAPTTTTTAAPTTTTTAPTTTTAAPTTTTTAPTTTTTAPTTTTAAPTTTTTTTTTTAAPAFIDFTQNNTPSTSVWTILNSGGTMTPSASHYTIASAGTAAAMIIYKTNVNKVVSSYTLVAQLHVVSGYYHSPMELFEKTTDQIMTNQDDYNLTRIIYGSFPTNDLANTAIVYKNASGVATLVFATIALPGDTDLVFKLELTTTTWRYTVKSVGGATTYLDSGTVLWTNTKAKATNWWIGIGEGNTLASDSHLYLKSFEVT